MIERGSPWERPVPDGTVPDAVITGGDGDLDRCLAGFRGTAPRIRWTPTPDSDFARALGLVAGAPSRGLALSCDLLRASGADLPAVNTIELGVFPPKWFTSTTPTTVEIDGRTVFSGSATSVVVASGQFRLGQEIIQKGHPGDGKAEVLVLALGRSARKQFERRMATGDHLPHPDVYVGAGADIAITMRDPQKLVGDGGVWTLPAVRAVEIRVEAAAFHLLV